jgi:hypothetical protein
MDASFIDIETDLGKAKNVSAVRQEVSWEGNYFLNRVIICDETWIHFFLTGKQTPEFCLEASFLAFPYKRDNFQVSREGDGDYIMWYIRCSAKPLCSSEMTVTGLYYATYLKRNSSAHIYLGRIHITSRQRAEPLKPRCHWYTRKTRRRTVTSPTLPPGPSNLWLLAVSNFKKQSLWYEIWVKGGTEVCRGQTAAGDVKWWTTTCVRVMGREIGQVQIVHGTLLWEGEIFFGTWIKSFPRYWNSLRIYWCTLVLYVSLVFIGYFTPI